MICTVKVVEFKPEGVCLKKLEPPGSDEQILVPYVEMFSSGPVRHFTGEARSNGQILRVGDVTQIERDTDDQWSRRSLLERTLRQTKNGDILFGRVAEIDDESVTVSTLPGWAVRCSLSLLEELLDRKKLDQDSDDGSRVFSGRLKLGDPLVGLCRFTEEAGVELDVRGYLERLDSTALVPEERRVLLEKTAPTKHTEKSRRSDTTVPCPPIGGTVMIIDDRRTWADSVRRWLEKGGAKVVILREEKWSDAGREAHKLSPDWILVDVHLDENSPNDEQGLEIARKLVEANSPWKVVIVTHANTDKIGPVPDGVHAVTSKTKWSASLARVLGGKSPLRITHPSSVIDTPASACRRSPNSTKRQVESLIELAEIALGASIAVFSYDFLDDKASFLFGNLDIESRFNDNADHMQKSQIRDLAYDRAEDAWTLYPARKDEEPWRWLRKLCEAPLQHALGIRLCLPDRDKSAVLFAFWMEPKDDWLEDLEQSIENRLILVDLRACGTAIEDACWHEKHESELVKNRDQIEHSRRSEDLGHEVKRYASSFHDAVSQIRDRLDPGDLAIEDTLDECMRSADHLESLADEILARIDAEPERLLLEKVLDECIARYSSAMLKIKVVGSIVQPKNLEFFGRRNLLVLLVDNLLRNAVRAIELAPRLVVDGGQERIGQIVLEACLVDGDGFHVQIFVHDTGCGISRLALDQMYEHHYSTFGGTGLGMGICRRAAERLGGRIEVLSTALLAGTTFRIVLPTGLPAPTTEVS